FKDVPEFFSGGMIQWIDYSNHVLLSHRIESTLSLNNRVPEIQPESHSLWTVNSKELQKIFPV
ncbi:MAG: hypothetical protein K0U86_15650, partial [Planctomycetes bacterium]|nr:hypothetical protein [Planctomycetota bacterium]